MHLSPQPVVQLNLFFHSLATFLWGPYLFSCFHRMSESLPHRLRASGMAALAWPEKPPEQPPVLPEAHWPLWLFWPTRVPCLSVRPFVLPLPSLSLHLNSWICVNKMYSFTSVLVLVIMFTSCLNSISQSMWKGWWFLKHIWCYNSHLLLIMQFIMDFFVCITDVRNSGSPQNQAF